MSHSPIPPLPSDDEILAAALEVTEKTRAGRSFPPLRTQEWLDLPYEDKVASLLVLACAWLLEDPRALTQRLRREVSLQVHAAAPPGWWARQADNPSAAELEQLRHPRRPA